MFVWPLLSAGAAADVRTGAAPVLSTAARTAEIEEKAQRLREFLQRESLDGVLIGTQRNFAWLTAGGDNHVVFNTEDGVALLLWTPTARHVIAANNEMPRFMDEELSGLGYEPAAFSWHEDISRGARSTLIARLVAGRRIGCDLPVPLPGTIDVGGKLAALRAQLAPPEIERYRWLARTAAQIVEATARDVRAGETEQEIQARVAARLLAQDILPTVLLVAADERIARYKHPVTKSTPVRRQAMITLCARKWGLVVAVTRHVHLGPVPAELQARQAAVGRVCAAMLAATRAGARSGDVITAARDTYAGVGYADAWQAHHLGGALGYREREYKAAPGSLQVMLDRQAFAWNPTLPGVKSEDTVLVNGDSLDVLTDTGAWPRATFEAGGRKFALPEILVIARRGLTD